MFYAKEMETYGVGVQTTIVRFYTKKDRDAYCETDYKKTEQCETRRFAVRARELTQSERRHALPAELLED